MILKKPSVLVAATVLGLVIGLGAPALAQGRGGGGGRGGSGGGSGGGGRGSGGPVAGAPGRGGPGRGGGGPVRAGAGRPSGGRYYGGRYYGGYARYPYYGYAYYGYPYWYGAYGYPYFYGAWGWPYGGYPYYGYGGYDGYDGDGGYAAPASLRLDVTPKQAEVYVDGFLAGTVDDFDGTFQRLQVPPDAHDLTLYRDGFKTVHQSLQLSPGSTFKVSYHMQPLMAGEVAEARPTPPPPPPDDENAGRPAGPPEGRPRPQGPPRRMPPAPRNAAGYGTLAIRVQPADAIVLIDGERWQTSSGQERLVVEVPEGPHRIEIRKEGFDTYATDITTPQGETVPINVSLRARQE